MIPFKTSISLDRQSEIPLYLQLVNGLVQLIQDGILLAGMKLPGSRKLAETLGLHRKTVVRSIEELDALGWIEILPNRGTFIANNLPTVRPRTLENTAPFKSNTSNTPSIFNTFSHLREPMFVKQHLAFDDGFPDTRFAPINELASTYTKNLRRSTKAGLSYGDARGNTYLRTTLADWLNKTRGLNITAEHIMITRGSQMAIFLAASATLKTGDNIIVGESNYFTANATFQHLGGNLLTVPVDAQGLQVEAIEALCKKHPIRAIYVTPHHHHPTTVTMPPERRIRLLALAEKYQFAILEDDYDYDFHYSNSPVLPLASADRQGFVLYIGSFTKSIAPAFRVGYLVGPPVLIKELIKVRRLLDRQGDMILEQSLGELLEKGIIRRHLKKALRHYQERRDICCKMLKEQLGEVISFDVPDGGLAIWAKFVPHVNLRVLKKAASKEGLYISDNLVFHIPGVDENAMRMGFASMNEGELTRAINILKRIIFP